jgi:hypothetical protein
MQGRCQRPTGLLVAVIVVLGGVACASPSERWRDRVDGLGFTSTTIQGQSFRHVILENAAPASRILHVYLDGDGTPWRGDRPAADPTPRSTLVLDLMRLDAHASVYLGRPCYHGLVADPGCAPALWTDARYSEPVVSSMAGALTRHLAARGHERLAFIGYSGGGSLAVLLAPRFPQTVAVVTVAANLDIDAWAARLHYRRLVGSLNPAWQPPLPPHVYQRHYVGARDLVVPQEIVARGHIDRTRIVVVPDFEHVCCWARLWPSIIADLTRATGSP